MYRTVILFFPYGLLLRAFSVKKNVLKCHTLLPVWTLRWTIIVSAQKIFGKFGDRHLKVSFGLQSVANDDLTAQERFRTHTQNFIEFLAVVVENLTSRSTFFFYSVYRKFCTHTCNWEIWRTDDSQLSIKTKKIPKN